MILFYAFSTCWSVLFGDTGGVFFNFFKKFFSLEEVRGWFISPPGKPPGPLLRNPSTVAGIRLKIAV